MRKRPVALLVGALLVTGLAGTAAADTTVRVTGDTVDAEGGWWFNRDTSTSTPYEFTMEEASIGGGSLHVLPIDSLADDGATVDAKDKFIGELFLSSDLAALDVSVDYLLGPDSTANQVYVNVYAIDPGSPAGKYYDCRFDYVADGSNAEVWQTLAFGQATPATHVATSGTRASGVPCPSTLAEMPTGSQVRVVSVNFGDTSTNDTGMSAYFDNVVVSGTTYDFEVPVAVKDACKDGGYAAYGFDNQGACVSSLQADEKAGK